MALHKDVRRQRAFDEFRRRLDEMSPDEIRRMLDERRIRSPERIELAEARLKQRDKAASGTTRATAGTAARARPRSDADGGDQSRAGEAPEARAAGGAARAAAAARASQEVPVARQVGRMLGIGLGVASLAALAVFAIRR